MHETLHLAVLDATLSCKVYNHVDPQRSFSSFSNDLDWSKPIYLTVADGCVIVAWDMSVASKLLLHSDSVASNIAQ